MSENLYKRYAKIRDIKGYTDYRVANITGIGTPTISNWKNGKYQPKDDKMEKIAELLDVSLDYLKGKTDKIMCPYCETYYNPTEESSCSFHKQQHSKYQEALEKYGFCYNSEKCQEDAFGLINILSSPTPQYSAQDIANVYIEYLKTEFSDLLRDSNYDIPYNTFDEYVKKQIIADAHENFMSIDLFSILAEKYGIEKEYLSGTDELLARISNNPQMMRILYYAEKLNPGMLDALEVQIKALAENNTKG